MKTVSSIAKMIVDLYIFSSLSALCPGDVGAECCLGTQDVLCFEALEKNTWESICWDTETMQVIPHLHAFPIRVNQSLAKIWNAHKLHYSPGWHVRITRVLASSDWVNRLSDRVSAVLDGVVLDNVQKFALL